jgi:tetratricopeptide (TPR) repeat protein
MDSGWFTGFAGGTTQEWSYSQRLHEESVALRALAIAYQGYFMGFLDLSEQGYELAKESVEILQQLNQPEALVYAHLSLGVNAYFLTRYTEQIKAVSNMLKTATEIDDKWLFAYSLWGASLGALLKEDFAEARRLAESSLNLNEEIGDVIGSTLPLIVLGHVALALGDYEGARGFYLRCIKISQEVGFHYSIQTSSKYLGKVALSMGKTAEAEIYLLQSLTITKEIGFVRDIINLLYEFARLRVAQDNTEQAVELLAVVIKHPASHTARMLEGPIRDSAKVLLAELEDELPQETYITALERGLELELDEVIADLLNASKRTHQI